MNPRMTRALPGERESRIAGKEPFRRVNGVGHIVAVVLLRWIECGPRRPGNPVVV